MVSASGPINGDVLNSWKEVAVYMGRGVRTVQRWERELGLPVRRPRGKSRSAVIAIKSELDQWLLKAPTEDFEPERTRGRVMTMTSNNVHVKTSAVTSKSRQLLARSHDIRQQTMDLCEKLNRNLTLMTTLADRSVPESKPLLMKAGNRK